MKHALFPRTYFSTLLSESTSVDDLTPFQGLYSLNILKNVLSLSLDILSIFKAYESKTSSDCLNHTD